MSRDLLLLAYLSPETFIPLMSLIAGAVGVALALGKHVWALPAAAIARLARLLLRK